jgi:SAM-dependent methyltransferase
VVANNAMNRGRGLDGVNSYTRELGFHPLDRLPPGGAWLDLCCGSGRALIEAAQRDPALSITGVDLVDHFDPGAGPEFIIASVNTWNPGRRFDLITCVHGLHYVGDKLGLIARAVSWLAPGGRFAAHLDLANVVVPGSFRPRRFGLGYDARRRLIIADGPLRIEFPYLYLGADDRAGPNTTGQPAVNSHYRAGAARPVLPR